MIFEHEIPSGSHLYFGESARIKRSIENGSALLLEKQGYQEIVTPLFSYHQHESFGSQKPLVRLNDAANHEVSLRADSTADVVRIVTKRLGRSSDVKKWFYIQPIFSFPTIEQYQIGAELIDGSFEEACQMSIALLSHQRVTPILQIANIAIPTLLNERYGITIEDIRSMNVEAILQSGLPWMEKLVHIHTLRDLEDLSMFPADIAFELQKIVQEASKLNYEQMVISPLYYAQMRYYDSLLFRLFEENRLYATGGIYEVDEVRAAGFAIYTDACVEKLIQKGDNA
jgi:histidyl-tRNA synthetase